MIEKVKFGEIVVRGKKYTSDIIIFWDGEIVEKEKSHKITEKDMEEILLKEPEVIVIGRGMGELVKVEEEAIALCEKENVKVRIYPTPEAVKEFNSLFREKKKVVGVFHLTC